MTKQSHKSNLFILISLFYFFTISQLHNFTSSLYAQDVTLEYIFQEPNIINPRPSLKFINSKFNKIYFYADDNYDWTLDLFEYDYKNEITTKIIDTANSPSEFIVLDNGDAISILNGDLFISKNFVNTRTFSKDIQLTKTDQYEYSPLIINNFLIYRRAGEYFLTKIDTLSGPEIQLTFDESDSISYQILGLSQSDNSDKSVVRLLMARYDNSAKTEYIFPDYSKEFVTVDRQKRGISKVKLLEYEVSKFKNKNDSLSFLVNEIKYPDTVRYSTQYAAYSPDPKNIILDVETLDRHTRKLFIYDVKKKALTNIYSESDFAWYERHGNATRYFNDSVIIFESEVSGYNNLYSIKTDGSEFRKIAGDNFTIIESVLDRLNNKLYFIANKDNPYEWNIYETDFTGSYLTKITNKAGGYEGLSISQDAENLFYSYSSITKPNEIYHWNKINNTEKQITNTISPLFSNIDWVIPEIISYNNDEDGQIIYAFLYKPKDYSRNKKYPLICFAHGQGYLQQVTKGFSPYQDNFMINSFLTSQGYLILDVDFRGSMGFGKDFRNKTYQNLGYWEVSDYISGINYLEKLGLIDRNKVGIYGGSYGGFISLMAAFRNPEYFKAAVALRAVSDWKNYFYGNWWFTLGRLGNYYDDENKKYYEVSSPITYADNLQIPLLITHSMLDDNVFFQQAVHLIQKLIDSKKDFEVMIYPKEYHSFRLQTSWLDLYKRIFNFFERHLK